MNLMKVNARPCDAKEIAQQVGKWNILAISGGRLHAITNDEGEVVGLRMPINGTRRVDIVLDWNDTYIVRRVRKVVRGANRGHETVETEFSDIYCDEVGEVAYKASCWK